MFKKLNNYMKDFFKLSSLRIRNCNCDSFAPSTCMLLSIFVPNLFFCQNGMFLDVLLLFNLSKLPFCQLKNDKMAVGSLLVLPKCQSCY